MNKFLAAALCFTVSAGTAKFMLHYADHPARLGPDGVTILAVAALVFMLSSITGFVLFVAQRDDRRRRSRPIQHNPKMDQEARSGLKDGVYSLIPGATYRVLRPITDYHKNVFPVGKELTFMERHYLPYEGGHTLVFIPERMYLQDGTDSEVLLALDRYLVMTAAPANPVKIEAGLNAHFKQPNGTSRPGIDWKMSLRGSPGTVFFVNTLYSSLYRPVPTEETYLRQRATAFVAAKLAAGWHPKPGERIEAGE